MNLRTIVWCIAVLLAIYLYGNYVDLFYKWKWFDMPMHFAGGFTVGMLAVYLMGKINFLDKPAWSQLIFAVGSALIVGVVWEYYEFAIETFVVERFGWQPMALRDTLSDLFLDSAGGAAAWGIFKKRI